MPRDEFSASDRPGPGLTAEQELDVALRTASDFRGSIAGADAKAGLLIPALGVGIGGAGNAIAAPSAGAWATAISLVLLGLVLTSALGALLSVIAVLTPRTPAPAGKPNLFAFPTFQPLRAAEDCRRAQPELCAQAWRQAETLARIANTKYLRLRTALRCSCAALLAFLVWTALRPLLAG
ncbi:Pycsar system effector family protein [Saccharopolyspora sp. MS10]|uniref:Pycsar system effector family protein n=1 Tax=Saccharopolyspora sp. MS10 TaxID=3385973 RepID=UPI00399FAE88